MCIGGIEEFSVVDDCNHKEQTMGRGPYIVNKGTYCTVEALLPRLCHRTSAASTLPAQGLARATSTQMHPKYELGIH